MDLQDKFGATIFDDLMTSSTIKGTDLDASKEATRISLGLSSLGYSVVRIKIETSYTHPSVPTISNGKTMPKDCYWECHLNVKCNNELLPKLQEFARLNGVHISKNVFKRLSGDWFTIMLTDRVYEGTYDDFKDRIDTLVSKLTPIYDLEKQIVEFALFDSKINHDSTWLDQK